ncbi:MAG: tRNA (N6-isopentenyl adenosine(37)-C2)-methylthiotransferase MiaB [Ruminococcaceae bacterium]|nr:tRNA (N6-isopentenyl adenosine(37)-C2)-methylthiotransferase MiaB [Oscillospiraceae bacterium]
MAATPKSRQISEEDKKRQKECTAQIRSANEAYTKANGRAPRAFVLTLGCQQNEADSEKLCGMAEACGYEITDKAEEAALIMVNTCAIREHAEQRALSLVGQYKHLKARNPELVIGICGCMVVQEHRIEDIKRRYPYVDLLFGTSSLHRFPELLLEKLTHKKRVLRGDETEYAVAEDIPIRRESTYRAWVSVMYGCNNFCSYCIVPYVRGRERSREKEAVIREVRELVEAGYRDITLLGQNVNSYGKDGDRSDDFADLLAELDTIEGDYWLHFMTSHPKDATRKLIDVMANARHVARHFHLPMQSGSDRILQAMNRRYTFEKYRDILTYIRKKMPDITVTSDLIVGFPGETEEDFAATLDALRQCRFDMIYSFIYSPRKGTPAAEMAEQIPQAVKSERYERLLAVQNEIALAVGEALIGKTVRVLCDGISKNNEKVYSGRTEGGKIVFFDTTPENTGKFLSVFVERAEPFALYGTVVKD